MKRWERDHAVAYLFIGMLLVLALFIASALSTHSLEAFGAGLAYVAIGMCLWKPADWLLSTLSEDRRRVDGTAVATTMVLWAIAFPVIGALSAMLAISRSVVPRADEGGDED